MGKKINAAMAMEMGEGKKGGGELNGDNERCTVESIY